MIETQGTSDSSSEKAFKDAMAKTITPSFFKEQVDKLIENLIDFITGKKTSIISFDLEKVKPQFKENLYQELNKSQSMSRSQFDVYWSNIEEDANQFFKVYKTNLGGAQDQGAVGQNAFSSAQRSYKILLILKYLFLGLAIILLAAIILMTRSSLKAVLRWPGYAVAISGLLILSLSTILKPLLNFLRDQLYANYQSLKESGSVIVDAINQIVQAGASRLIIVSIVIFAVGLVLVIASYIISEKNNQAISS
jgi:hypothetical protein